MAHLTKADVLKKAEDLKNWGKWGPDDELGVLNYVTPEDIVPRQSEEPKTGCQCEPTAPLALSSSERRDPHTSRATDRCAARAGRSNIGIFIKQKDD